MILEHYLVIHKPFWNDSQAILGVSKTILKWFSNNSWTILKWFSGDCQWFMNNSEMIQLSCANQFYNPLASWCIARIRVPAESIILWITVHFTLWAQVTSGCFQVYLPELSIIFLALICGIRSTAYWLLRHTHILLKGTAIALPANDFSKYFAGIITQ